MKAPRFIRTKGNRLMFFGSILVICVSATIYFALQEETYAEQFLSQFFQPKVSKFLLIAIPAIVGVIVLGVSNEIFSGDLHDWMKGEKDDEKTAKESIQNIEPELEILYDSLKERYQKRYDSKLDGRFEITLEVNEDWRFDKPATYKFSAEAKVSEAAAAVRKAFDDKGRLLIVGNAGSGKTVLLLKLALGLLGDGYETDKQIPVIFNLASWRGTYENFEDWLIEVLNTGNGLSKDFAKTVLREKKIIFLLDGLDELARNEEPQTADEIRAKCMESLNDYLREGRRTVICCRREEFAAMQKTTAQDAPVSAKVEVLDLTKADIILALQQAQTHNESRAAAENLEKLIETNETVLEVLSTPFYFTTALEVLDKQKLNVTDLPNASDEFKNYLLENYVDNKIKYTTFSNEKKHIVKLSDFEADSKKIKHWLSQIARIMESNNNSVLFQLTDLHPINLRYRWVYSLLIGGIFGISIGVGVAIVNYFGISLGDNVENGLKRGLISGFSVGLIRSFQAKLNIGLVQGLSFGISVGIIGGALFGLTVGLRPEYLWIIAGFIYGLFSALFDYFNVLKDTKITTDDIIKFKVIDKLFSREFWLQTLTDCLIVMIVSSAVLFFAVDGQTAITGGLICGIFILIISSYERIKSVEFYTQISKPYQKIYGGFLVNFTFYFLLNLIIAFVIYFVIKNQSLNFNNEIILSLLTSLLLIYTHLAFYTPLFRHWILRFCLYFEKQLPLDLVSFLDLAAEARILEKDGGQWRFRHQNLQEYFAELETEK